MSVAPIKGSSTGEGLEGSPRGLQKIWCNYTNELSVAASSEVGAPSYWDRTLGDQPLHWRFAALPKVARPDLARFTLRSHRRPLDVLAGAELKGFHVFSGWRTDPAVAMCQRTGSTPMGCLLA